MPSPSPHPSPIYILGISCYYHDSAAVLLKDGEIVFAAQEERYTRKKHDESFPKEAIAHALAFANITIDDLSAVGFYEKPFLKFFDRILTTFFKTGPLFYIEHHEPHAASSYYCSGFENATVVTVDGVGEWATTTIGVGRGNDL